MRNEARKRSDMCLSSQPKSKLGTKPVKKTLEKLVLRVKSRLPLATLIAKRLRRFLRTPVLVVGRYRSE